MDVVAVFLVLCVVRTLNVPRGTDVDMDGAVNVEGVVEHVVVVTDGRHVSEDEVGVGADRDVLGRDMTSNGIRGVHFEQANGIGVRVADFPGVERGVHVGRLRGAVKALNELERGRAEAVVTIKVGGVGLERIDGGIVRKSLVETQLVDDPLALVVNVVQLQASIAGEADVKAKAHCKESADVLAKR